MLIIPIIIMIWACHVSFDQNKDKETRKQARVTLSKCIVSLLRYFKF